MTSTNQGDVIAVLLELADSLVADFDTIDLLQRLVDSCTRLLDVRAAGLLLVGGDGQLHVAAASSEQVRVLELIQLHGASGPCLDAFRGGERVVAAGHLELSRRWPGFAPDMDRAGFHNVAAVPLRLREHRLGALGLFNDAQRLPDPADVDVDVAQAFADIATIAILQHQAVHDSQTVSAQLSQALESRIVIEQAKGVVAAQLGVDVAGAFTLIRDHARTRHVSLPAIAGDIVTGRLTADELHRRPSRPAPRRRR